MAKDALLIMLVFFVACSLQISTGSASHRLFLKGSSAQKSEENGVSTLITKRKIFGDVLIPNPGNVIKFVPPFKTMYGDDNGCYDESCIDDSCEHTKVDECECTSKIYPRRLPPHITKDRHFCVIWGGKAQEQHDQYLSSDLDDYSSEDNAYPSMNTGEVDNLSSEDNDDATHDHEYTDVSSNVHQNLDYFANLTDDSRDGDYMETDESSETSGSDQSAVLTADLSESAAGSESDNAYNSSDETTLTLRETEG